MIARFGLLMGSAWLGRLVSGGCLVTNEAKETARASEPEAKETARGSEPESIKDLLARAPWSGLEEHLDGLRDRVDSSVEIAHSLRKKYREELLAESPELAEKIQRPSKGALEQARKLLTDGSVAAADGTIAPVPLLGGAKIQVGVVIVFNTGDVVDLVTRVFEAELSSGAKSGREFFEQLRKTRQFSVLVSRAIMLFGERRLLLDHAADWRMVHGELIPHELRTGAGRPKKNLPDTFDLINGYIESECFIAVSESTSDLDVLNAAIVLDPGEYIVIRTLEDTLRIFLEGDDSGTQSRANFAQADERRFREFMESAGPEVSVVLVKSGSRPYLIECHHKRIEEAVALFYTDAAWTRGLSDDGSGFAIRGFPFHLDLADQAAGTLFKAGDFRDFVESRLMRLGIEEGLFDLDPRRTRA
jgi:hypothetical protein